MARKLRLLMVMAFAIAVSLPVGFAIGQVVCGGGEAEPEVAEVNTNAPAIAAMNELNEAFASGDAEALEEAKAAVTEQIVGRLNPEEQEAFENASPPPKVPAGTLAYVAEEIGPGQIALCEEEAKQMGEESRLCKLMTLHAEGKLRAGAFSAAQVAEATDGSDAE